MTKLDVIQVITSVVLVCDNVIEENIIVFGNKKTSKT